MCGTSAQPGTPNHSEHDFNLQLRFLETGHAAGLLEQRDGHLEWIGPRPYMKAEEISDRFRFVGERGEGCFGTVVTVRDLESGFVFARKQIFVDMRYVNRERKIISRICHPNIARLAFYSNKWYKTEDDVEADHDLSSLIKSQIKRSQSRNRGSPDGFLIDTLLMEWMPSDLTNYCRRARGRTRDLVEVKIFAWQLLRALAAIHFSGVTHRDCKPSNILIDPLSKRLKLCDFGSAKNNTDESDISVAYIVSRWYRAPELHLGSTAYSVSIDMWSFGCIVAEMIWGEALFKGDNTENQFARILIALGPPTMQETVAMNQNCNFKFPQLPYRRGIDAQLMEMKNKADAFPDRMAHTSIPFIKELGEFLDLVLVYNPEDRRPAAELMCHNWFDDMHEYARNNASLNSVLYDWTRTENLYLHRVILELASFP